MMYVINKKAMFVGLFLLFSCSDQSTDLPASTTTPVPETQTEQKDQVTPKIIIIGDSITAGLGVAEDKVYPTLLADKFQQEGMPTTVLNGGLSGDTTAGGLRRIDWYLKQNPDLLLIELGGNDGLRGISLADIEANLGAMIEKAQAAKVDVRLIQMQVPANFGQEYTDGFFALYSKVAKQYNVPLLPFLLDGVAGDRKYNQPDGIHPTEEGHALIADTMFAQLKDWRKD